MSYAKIEFASDGDAAKALHGVMQRGRITGLRDGSFLVPSAALSWLASEKIHFKLLQSLNQDDVVQTLRDHLTHPA